MNNYIMFLLGVLVTLVVLFVYLGLNKDYVYIPYQQWIAVQEWQADKCYPYNTDASIGVGH